MGRGKRMVQWVKRFFLRRKRKSRRNVCKKRSRQHLVESKQTSAQLQESPHLDRSSNSITILTSPGPPAQHKETDTAIWRDNSHQHLDPALEAGPNEITPFLLPRHDKQENSDCDHTDVSTNQSSKANIMEEKRGQSLPLTTGCFSTGPIRYQRMERVELNHLSLLGGGGRTVSVRESRMVKEITVVQGASRLRRSASTGDVRPFLRDSSLLPATSENAILCRGVGLQCVDGELHPPSLSKQQQLAEREHLLGNEEVRRSSRTQGTRD